MYSIHPYARHIYFEMNPPIGKCLPLHFCILCVGYYLKKKKNNLIEFHWKSQTLGHICYIMVLFLKTKTLLSRRQIEIILHDRSQSLL